MVEDDIRKMDIGQIIEGFENFYVQVYLEDIEELMNVINRRIKC